MARITLIGAGNVGFHLGRRLVEKGAVIEQVFSRDKEKAKDLAAQIGAEPVDNLKEISSNADLYILAVSDDAIGMVAERLSEQFPEAKAVVHTSGAASSTLLAPYFRQYGIFYPLQSFSRQRQPDFDRIPICIFSPQAALEQELFELGRMISQNVHRIDDEQRAVLHVAAVFVNNFTNYLFQAGQEILERERLPFELLLPLILETAQKVQEYPAREMQTGPARRGDLATIERHLDYLKKFPKFAALYELLTNAILKEWLKG